MTIHTVDLNLQARIIFNKRRVRVLATFKFPLQEHNLLILVFYLHLDVPYLCVELYISATLLIDPSLNVEVLFLVPHL